MEKPNYKLFVFLVKVIKDDIRLLLRIKFKYFNNTSAIIKLSNDQTKKLRRFIND